MPQLTPPSHPPATPPSESAPQVSRHEILRLAVPALGALVAEPLFLLADSAMVGHLSTQALAGLGLASTVLTTLVGLAVFLAYSTTAASARALGEGKQALALQRGLDAVALAALIGIGLGAAVALLAPTIIGWFGPASAEVAEQGARYLSISAAGLPAMLVVLAATGLVRGLQDTVTPLRVSVVGAVANGALNWLLMFGLGLGIAGSALGTVLVQWGMALALLAVVARAAREAGVKLRPALAGVRSSWSEGLPLLIRTLALRAVLVSMAALAAGLGDVPLAAHQLTLTFFGLLSMALDALAIAGQALTGRFLGQGKPRAVQSVTHQLTRFGVWGGSILTLLMLAAALLLPGLFTPDPATQRSLQYSLAVLALVQPLCGYVFVLDGVLMGAGDARYLAKASVLTLLTYTPFAAAIAWSNLGGSRGLAALWLAFGLVFMGARAYTLWRRTRSDAWMHLPAAHGVGEGR